MEDIKESHKPHRKSRTGRKVERKKKKDDDSSAQMSARLRNPKAFAYHSANKVAKVVRRTLDIQTKKHHLPVVDRAPVEPPPVVVAIVGPPKVGKSTLMQCLIKNFTRQKIPRVQGPVTLISGKHKRLTIIECNNDINSMIDVAKVADLVLLLVDASFGFEMETFEFLNICQVHGCPKIMGVLTHLDLMKNNKALKKKKKQMKHRFWTEIYQGAKLFYLSGVVNGEYQKTEVHNLGRFISVMKFRPQMWKTTFPYLLADRMEDITDPESLRQEPKRNRTVTLYGYVRGTPFKNKSAIHIPGCGDFQIKDMAFLPDPCALPSELKKRSLNEQERLAYAPFSGVGGIVYDKDAVYIDLGGRQGQQGLSKDEDEPMNELVSTIINTTQTMDSKMAASDLQVFAGAQPLSHKDAAGGDESSSDDDDAEADEDADDQSDVSDEEDEIRDVPLKKAQPVEGKEYDPVQKRFRRKAIFPSSKEDGNSEQLPEGSDGSDSSDGEDYSMVEPSKTSGETDGIESGDDSDDDDVEDSEEDSGEEEDNEESSGEEEDGSEEEEDDSDSDDLEKGLDKLAKKEMERIDEGEEELQNDPTGLQWKENLAQKASMAFLKQQKATPNLRKLVYGTVHEVQSDSESDADEMGGLFKITRKSKKEQIMDGLDSSRFESTDFDEMPVEEIKELIKDCFVTGKWRKSEDAATLLEDDDDDLDMLGDFEDLEASPSAKRKKSADSESESDEDADDPAAAEKPEEENTQKSKRLTKEDKAKKLAEKRAEKKKRMKELFDAEYDNQGNKDGTYFDDVKTELQEQAKLNRKEFQSMDDSVRVQYEGFRPGMYVRLEIDSMPCEFVEHFDPTYPVLVGGLGMAQETVGYIQMRIKKHRWHQKILKNRDPLVFSLGWRRFQAMPVFSIQDHNGRQRMLKYTPEHAHCSATLWGPITPQNTGFLCIQNSSEATTGFRIAATGVVLELDKSKNVVKKLKLTGSPMKVFKKTAFIKDMFSSQVEVSKFLGAQLRTVSGVRGQIKKAIRAPPGCFRATFEDKILLSDIVFVRTWYSVEIPKFYNPVTTHYLPAGEKGRWLGMKTVGQLRRERGMSIPVREDSRYKPIVRKAKTDQPLIIPKALQQSLPFKDKPKVTPRVKDVTQSNRVAVVREPQERKTAQLMKMLKTLYEDKMKKRRKVMRERAQKHQAAQAKVTAQREAKQKVARKEIYRSLGQMEARKGKKRDRR